MYKTLILLIAMFPLILSGKAFAHAMPFTHMLIENNTLHLLIHTGITLTIGISAFFIGHRVMQTLLSSKKAKD